MRSNLRILAALLFVGWLSFCPACSDDLTQVGSSTLPDGDRNTVYSDTFQMTAATVRVDSLYLRSSDGMLGNLDDPAFGQIKYDYLCQFYCVQGFRFPHTPHNGRIDSVVLRLRFYNWTGDARVSMRARVYALNRQPVRSPYGRLNPEDYADMQTVLGTRVYRLTDFPSLRNDSTIRDLYNASTRSYQPVSIHGRDLRITLPKSLGQSFYDETVARPASFATQDAFNRFFPGLYITTDYGIGSMIEVGETRLLIYYSRPKSAKNDTLVRDSVTFRFTREVIQYNHIRTSDDNSLLRPSADSFAYVKTPSGICPRIVIPAAEIARKTQGRVLNAASLSLRFMPQDAWNDALVPPPFLLLLPEDSVRAFFDNRTIDNGLLYLRSTNESNSPDIGFDAITRNYRFANIAPIIQAHIRRNPGTDLRLLAIPIDRRYSVTTDRNNQPTRQTTAIIPYLYPGGVRLRVDPASMKLVLLSSQHGTGLR